MDLYLVGPESETVMNKIITEYNSNILFSYLAGKKHTEKYKSILPPRKLFIDSGAYTAWTKGAELNVDEYIDWINSYSDVITLYGQIDIIPGNKIHGYTQQQVKDAAEKTWENYLYMRPKMKNPNGLLYTFHVGEPYEFLTNALNWTDSAGNSIEYIALGGMVGKPRTVRKAFLDKCYRIIKESKNPTVKVHTFGMTDFDLLEKYPITSSDSTTWIMAGANGEIITDNGRIKISDNFKHSPDHYSHLDTEHQQQIQTSINDSGFTLDELSADSKCRKMYNAYYLTERVKRLKQHEIKLKRTLF